MPDRAIAEDVEKALMLSVQEDDRDQPGGPSSNYFFGLSFGKSGSILSPWGTAARQTELRRLFYRANNTLVTSAIQQLIRQVKQTPHELIGGPTLTSHFQDMMQMADQGAGWDQFLTKLLTDYFTLDIGGVIELVGPGPKDQPLLTPPTALVALDALRCYFSGNHDHPVYYQSHRTNKLHRMHWTRIVRLVDMPSPDPFYRGMGFSALSRAAAIAQAEIDMTKMELDNLSDQPINGIIIFSGIAQKKLEKKFADHAENRDQADVLPLLRNLLQLTSTEAEGKVDAKVIPFSQLPANYDYKDLQMSHVNLTALAIGVDPQDLWPLSSGAMGSGAQSKILHAKTQGKALADTLNLLARTWNISILPRAMEFRYKPRDTEREQSDANIATSWGTLAQNLFAAGMIDQVQASLLLSNNVQAFSDVLIDQSGQIRLPDIDPKVQGPGAAKTAGGDLGGAGADGNKPAPRPPTPGIADSGQPNSQSHNPPTSVSGSDRRTLVKKELTEYLKMKRPTFREEFMELAREAFYEELLNAGVWPQDVTKRDEDQMLKKAFRMLDAAEMHLDLIVKELDPAAIDRHWTMGSLSSLNWIVQYLRPMKEVAQERAGRDDYYKSIELPLHVHRMSEWVKNGYSPVLLTKAEGPSQGMF